MENDYQELTVKWAKVECLERRKRNSIVKREECFMTKWISVPGVNLNPPGSL